MSAMAESSKTSAGRLNRIPCFDSFVCQAAPHLRHPLQSPNWQQLMFDDCMWDFHHKFYGRADLCLFHIAARPLTLACSSPIFIIFRLRKTIAGNGKLGKTAQAFYQWQWKLTECLFPTLRYLTFLESMLEGSTTPDEEIRSLLVIATVFVYI